MIELDWNIKTDLDISKIYRFIDKNSNHPKGCWEWTGLAKDGYGKYKIQRKGKVKCFTVTRLLWEYYYCKIPDGWVVRHKKCDNSLCCRIDHLKVGTHKQNSEDAALNNRVSCGENFSKSKLTEIEVREIVELSKDFKNKYKDIGKQFNVTQSTILSIVRGESWRKVTGINPKEKHSRKEKENLSKSDLNILEWMIQNTSTSDDDLSFIFKTTRETIRRMRIRFDKYFSFDEKRSCYKEEQILKFLDYYENNKEKSFNQIAKDLGVSYYFIKELLTGKIWTRLTKDGINKC